MRSLGSHLGTVLFVFLTLPPSLSPQTKPAITGVVVTQDGRPIAGVQVWGSAWKQCCPVEYEHMASGQDGTFQLSHSVPIIYFTKDGLQPVTVVTRRLTNFHVTMQVATNSMILRPCIPATGGQRQIPSGKYGLHFTVVKREVKILGGKPDVDYVKYVIKSKEKNSKSWLELWFGPYAMPGEPDEDQFLHSADFSQRNVTFPDGAPIGIDTSGHMSDGTSWRQMGGVLGSGARYIASANEANLFDKIINSACLTPYSSSAK
jgi:hypothetical protein